MMTPESLREALEYTARRTGFAAVLIEKDYYCSLILKALYEDEGLRKSLIFKGGTLLAKGYFDFFRLSEDLDFSVLNEFCSERSQRRKVADSLRQTIPSLLQALNLHEVSAFRGFNESRQYNGIFGYTSVVGPAETIKFEVGFRGDLMLPTQQVALNTLLEDPLAQKRSFAPFSAHVLAKEEAFAEKTRAALSRKVPAIRDFFDIDAIFQAGFDLYSESFLRLVQRKIETDASAQINLTHEKKSVLQQQIDTDLKPVLQSSVKFTLDESWRVLQTLAKRLEVYGYSS
jgi:predicted nucleotidyltransferase component of viral defense system